MFKFIEFIEFIIFTYIDYFSISSLILLKNNWGLSPLKIENICIYTMPC